jgi:hypothetical protein
MAKPRKKAPRRSTTKRPKRAKKPKAKRRVPRPKKRATTARKRPRPKRTAAPRRRATRTRSPAARVARVARPEAAAAPDVAAETGLAADVTAALRSRGDAFPEPDVVEAIATVCAGYRQGPGSDSPLGIPFDADLAVAREFVDRFLKGAPRAVPDREMHRRTVRSTIDGTLAQAGLADVGEVARATLTSLSLGAWEPGFDEHAERNAIAGFMVRWYDAGRA